MSTETKNTGEAKRIAYLGIPGSYSHQACNEYFPGDIYDGRNKFADVIHSIVEGEADYAMMPVENSAAGRVAEVYNLLPTAGLFIVGEYLLPIRHSLVVSKQAFRGRLPHDMDAAEAMKWKEMPLTEKEIARVYAEAREVRSHPQALMQCAGFLEKHLPNVRTEAEFDTATAARSISKNEDCKITAIASRHVVKYYNVSIVAENIEDDPHNMTRFLVLSRDALDPATLKGPSLTTILFQTGHKPGALLSALKAFADNGVNLTKLETYMISQERPNPMFYVDVGTSLANPQMEKAMAEFKNHTASCRILGSYPASLNRGQKNSFLPVS